MKSPLVLRLLVAAIHDVQRLQPDVKGLDRDVISIKARFEHEGTGFFADALSSLCQAVDYGLASGRFACPLGFRKSRGGALPRLFSGLLCKVFDSRTGLHLQNGSVESVKSLRQILLFCKKFQCSSSREKDLHERAVGVFWDTDMACQELFTPGRASLLSRVSRFGLVNLGSFNQERVHPKHGPGAVYERLAPNQKWLGIYQSILNEDFGHSSYGIERFGILQSDAGPSETFVPLHHSEGYVGTVESVPCHRLSSGHVARLTSVAKNSTSRRTITIEPLVSMFYQQGLNTVLRDNIAQCAVLSRSLSLTDQSINQAMALEGSRTGEWSTLDLSAASDRLSLSLVQLVLGHHSSFYSAMIECRSSHVLDWKNQPRAVKKFAGMGNALTFPVQSIVFANIAIAGILFSEGFSRPSYRDVRRVASLVRVYGDDIIVPTHYARHVVDWIESFGLKVNQKKSFTEGNFRESCGLDAYKGYDVTPVYLRDDPDTIAADPSIAASLVSTSNQLWLLAMYRSATVLSEVVEANLGRLPILSPESGGLGWHTRYGECEYQRWNKHLHMLEVRAPVLIPKVIKDRIDDYAALLKFFLTPLIQRGSGHLSKSVKRFNNRIAWRWMPANAGFLLFDELAVLKPLVEKYTKELTFRRPVRREIRSHQRKSRR